MIKFKLAEMSLDRPSIQPPTKKSIMIVAAVLHSQVYALCNYELRLLFSITKQKVADRFYNLPADAC